MTLLSCIYFYSFLNGVDPRITQAVIQTESSGKVNAIGAIGEVGLMQIRPEHVPESPLQLLNPCANVKRGTAILRRAMKKCAHKLDYTWTICFNLGVAGGAKIKHPRKWPYYKKIVGKL